MSATARLIAKTALALGAGLFSLAGTTPARAFCRATTCSKAKCATDALSCVTEGNPLFWNSDCITLSVQSGGAPHAGVDYDAAKASLERAVEAWTSVDCPGGGHPSLTVKISAPVECAASEYSSERGNANILMFRDDVWPYEGQSPDTLGFTRVHFDPDTGELYDADIELNGVAEPLAVGREPASNEADLDSILTHEVGHLFGLGHSPNVEATMVGGYVDGTFELRTPAPDDIAGICKIYPPGRKPTSSSCEPRHGFSGLCAAEQAANPDQGAAGAADGAIDSNDTSSGCSLGPARKSSRVPPVAVVIVLGLSAGVRRRRR
jgi:hypothetical protein